jgi:corrinoid protein of di/trimethylamine methyltransferase
MALEQLLKEMAQSVIDGEPEVAVALAQKGIEDGYDPLTMIEQGYGKGIQEVGDLFERGEYFLPHLIIGAKAMQQAMSVLEPELSKRGEARGVLGVAVLGTVRGDIHEIGKSLVRAMMSAAGFRVYDLGSDVPVERFVAAVKENGANIVGLSALLTTTMQGQREVIEALRKEGIRDRVKVMVGGAPVTRAWSEEIGADGYAEDAISAVQLAKRLVAAE